MFISSCHRRCVRRVYPCILSIPLTVSCSYSTGQWGTGTPFLSTTGSSNYSCVGLVTTTGNSSSVNQHPSPPGPTNHAPIIAGVIVSVLAILMILLLAVFLDRRRKRLMKQQQAEPAFIPEAWSPPDTGMHPDALSSVPLLPGVGGMARPSSKQSRSFGSRQDFSSASPEFAMSEFSTTRPSGALSTPESQEPSPRVSGVSSTAPAATGVLSKAQRIRAARAEASGSNSAAQSSTGLPPGLPTGWQVEPDIIIQHRDGGVVQEIPPPYTDRSGGNGNRQ